MYTFKNWFISILLTLPIIASFVFPVDAVKRKKKAYNYIISDINDYLW